MTGYRFTHALDVSFRDLDALGHVNNATYLSYLESARIAYWLHTTGREGLSGLDMMLARAEVDYRSPLGFGDRVEIGVRCLSMGRSSFVLGFRVEEVGSGRLVAEARKVCVSFDFSQNRSQPLSPELRARLRAQDPDCEERA